MPLIAGMKRKSLIAIALLLVAATAVLVHRAALAKETPQYRFTTVERGDLQSTVSATGTISAVTTVSVGTQVSGQISALLVDFNDSVKKGQLLARIDPTLAQQAVADAQANLEKAQAQAALASRDYSRNRELTGEGLVARSAFEQTEASAQVANASVKSARVALQRAQQNLAYTNIYAPIDGVVVARSVDAGQTVAASMSAPELFKIANDLSEMQILAQVGESDIARIEEGQPVEFTVQALPNRKFQGKVRQVRLESTTQDNVVNYTVVVAVDNSSGKLLPGMTARAKFQTKSAKDVLKVANSALRFKPEGAKTTARGGSLYTLDAQGKLVATRVRTGISDGTTTEVRGDGIKAGMKVIAGMSATAQSAETASNPFQSNQQQPQRRGPGGF